MTVRCESVAIIWFALSSHQFSVCNSGINPLKDIHVVSPSALCWIDLIRI